MNEKLLKCPFCGGEAKVSYKNHRFYGWNGLGQRKIKYRVQVICNKCRSRGKPIITAWLIDPNPYANTAKQIEMFKPYVEKAINAWNTRVKE